MTSLRLNQFNLARDAEFRGIVEATAMSAAGDVLNEWAGTTNHTNRVALAHLIISGVDPERFRALERFSWVAALNPSVQTKVMVNGQVVIANVEDGDIEYIVASNWDIISGNA